MAVCFHSTITLHSALLDFTTVRELNECILGLCCSKWLLEETRHRMQLLLLGRVIDGTWDQTVVSTCSRPLGWDFSAVSQELQVFLNVRILDCRVLNELKLGGDRHSKVLKLAKIPPYALFLPLLVSKIVSDLPLLRKRWQFVLSFQTNHK